MNLVPFVSLVYVKHELLIQEGLKLEQEYNSRGRYLLAIGFISRLSVVQMNPSAMNIIIDLQL